MHEVEHARRGHCGAAPASVAAYEANEATAMEAGAQAVLALAKDAARRRPAMALRTEECASCYTGDRRACPQGDAILQEVRRTLAPL
jgi:hypothetical protein